MTFPELKAAIDRTHAGLTVTNRVCAQFLKSVHAVCKSMGHTAESAKGARSKMLGDMIRFGASAIFLTVTPDDGNSLRIQIFVQQETNEAPDPMLASNEDIKADFDLSIERRQIYPGFCAFDFQQITELMIQYILGWDRKAQASYDEGGVFSVLEAWSATIEEQGRKTLHLHWILYTLNNGRNC